MAAAEDKIITLSIYRYDPDKDDKPVMKNYDVTVPAGADMMVLSALNKVKEQEPSLSYRHSCREGVCGSDGMNINGKNGLACVTSVLSLKSPIVLRPLPGFPVIRDLVVDMTQFFNQYERVEPYLKTDQPAPAKERRQSPEDRAKLDGLYECILCGCCTSSCPSYWWNPDKFLGPAALLQSWRFLEDTRDTAGDERLAEMEDPFSLFRCRSIMNCTDVCPKALNPTEAISKIRTKMLQRET